MRTPGVLSCLCIARTNRGCRGFDSARRAAAARQRQPFTACQPALQREPSTKTRLSQRDEGDAVTSNLKHAGMHKKDRQTHTHTPSSRPLSSMQWDSSWPVPLSLTLMSLLCCVQVLSSHLSATVSLIFFYTRFRVLHKNLYLHHSCTKIQKKVVKSVKS